MSSPARPPCQLRSISFRSPEGWQDRLVKVQNVNTAESGGGLQFTGWCLDKEERGACGRMARVLGPAILWIVDRGLGAGCGMRRVSPAGPALGPARRCR